MARKKSEPLDKEIREFRKILRKLVRFENNKRKPLSKLILPCHDKKGVAPEDYISLDGKVFKHYEDYVLHETGLVLSTPTDSEGKVDPLDILIKAMKYDVNH